LKEIAVQIPQKQQFQTNVQTAEGYAFDQMMNATPYLTPDALMSYCSTRLRGIDDQVHAAFAKQQQANADSSVLTNINIAVPDHQLDMSNDADKGTAQNALDQLQAAYDKIQDPTAKDALAHQIDALQHLIKGDNGGKMDVETFKSTTSGAVQKIQQDLNSGAELSMINLQSLMSQRQSAIQVCTNLVQSLGDQCSKIADNVGK
jgi:hypothetical protein